MGCKRLHTNIQSRAHHKIALATNVIGILPNILAVSMVLRRVTGLIKSFILNLNRLSSMQLLPIYVRGLPCLKYCNINRCKAECTTQCRMVMSCDKKVYTVDPAKNDPFCPVLTLSRGVTVVFLHTISNIKYVYPIEK